LKNKQEGKNIGCEERNN